jgi:adenosine/AMP kinase
MDEKNGFLNIPIQLTENTQLILAQSHFIKTVEDVYECLVNSVPGIKFGIAFCEASGPCLVRHQGNDDNLESLATDYAYKIGAGHSLVLLVKNAFPINFLPRLKNVPEIVNIYCATANPIEVIIVETKLGRAIIGVVDGMKPKGIESETDMQDRKKFLRQIGYKL